jgi:hypothetical protein
MLLFFVVPTTTVVFVDYLAKARQSGIPGMAYILDSEVKLFLGPLLLTRATLHLGVLFILRRLDAGL